MLHSILLAAAANQNTPTDLVGWQEAAIMTGVCLLVLFITSRTIQRPHDGPKMPLPFPSLFNNISVGGFLGAMSFGHLLGALTIFGLAPYLK